MKITCDSCGSKYTIADAKVKGRKVKVRCKSCKSTILVDGTAPAEEEPTAFSPNAAAAPTNSLHPSISPSDPSGSSAAAPSAGAGGAAGAGVGGAPVAKAPAGARAPAVRRDTWSVNLSDDDSRDMTTAEIIAGWKSGLVTTDAYVWKDGMEDWKPVLEMPELKQKLLAAKPLPNDGIVSSAQFPPTPQADPHADLFGGVSTAGSEAEAAAPPPPGGAEAKKAPGARNESSVLFSLDAMTGGAPGQPQTGGSANTADIFGGLGGGGNLVANPDLLTAPAKEPPPAPVVQQAPVAVGGAGAPAKKGKGGLIAAIGGVVVIAAGALFFFVGGGGPEEGEKAALTTEDEEAKKALEEARKKKEEAARIAAELEKAKKELEEAKKKKEGDASQEDQTDDDKEKEEEKEEDAQDSSASADSGDSGKSTGSSSTSSKSKSKSKPKFNVSAAKSSLSRAAANAAGCKKAGGPTGTGKVHVTFAPSGRATSARVVSGPFGGTSVGGCVASIFRRARVPPFSGGSKTVAKSFRIN